MLEVKNVSVHYDIIHALKDVSLEVKTGEIVSLIGANGAGKTTLLKALSGLIKIDYGEVILEGVNVQKLPSEKIVASGMVHVPEGRHVFASMSVEENLLMGAYLRKDKEGIERDLKMIYARFPRLKERCKQQASTLSGGEQQMLAIGRAIMSRPKILLLDEPSMGLAPILVQEIFSIIKEINEMGVTILLIEQNAKMALSISNRAYVIENGEIVLTGTGESLLHSEKVKQAYLGG